jgi:hypothetical protein
MVRSPLPSSASAVLLALLAGAPSPARAVDPTVSLDYSTYIGTPQSGTGVTEWLGIRYAAPPLGDLRFARPQDPATVSTPQPANQVSLSLGPELAPPDGGEKTCQCQLHVVHSLAPPQPNGARMNNHLTGVIKSSMASSVSALESPPTRPTPRRTACTSTSTRPAMPPRRPGCPSSSLSRAVASTRTPTPITTAQAWSTRPATTLSWSP